MDKNLSMMNKTLSLIEEENEDDFFTNNEEDRASNSQQNNFGDTRKLYPCEITEDLRRIDESSSMSYTMEVSNIKTITEIPYIVRDIESMEK